MKYCCQNWDKKYDCVQFFFQRVEEMLFHYSLDIVRVPLHNSKTLLLEYLSVESEVAKKRVGAYQLEEIFCELYDSIKNDTILIKHFGETFVEEVLESMKKDRSQTIHYLNNKISTKDYLNLATKYLKENVSIENHKKEVEFGIRAWITMIIYIGYSAEYIYGYLKDEFCKPVDKPVTFFEKFIDSFVVSEKTFHVYFSFAPSLRNYRELLGERLNIKYNNECRFKCLRKYKNDFVGYFEVKSFDPYAAMKRAYSTINIFLKFYRVISNHNSQLIRKFGVVVNADNGEKVEIPVQPLGYRSIEIKPNTDLRGIIDKIITNCQSKKETYIKLNRIIDLHNDAIQQPDLKDGFLNLWSILEIIGNDVEADSKISGVLSSIIPIIQKDYFANVFYNIRDDLEDNLKNEDYSNLLSKIGAEGANIGERIAAFVLLEEYKELREEYFKKLSNYPVIRNKIYNLWKKRNSKKELFAINLKYIKRIKWHIYRLYRTRNSIVHSGKSGYGLQMLGEHLHIYVDGVITELIVKLSEDRTLQTISNVLIDAKLTLTHMSNKFELNEEIDETDLKLIFKDVFYVYN